MEHDEEAHHNNLNRQCTKKKCKKKNIKRSNSGSNNNSPRKALKDRKNSSTLNAVYKAESSVEEKVMIEDEDKKYRFVKLTTLD